MKNKFAIGFASLLFSGFAGAQGLYYMGTEAQESMPLKWTVGADLTYDDNVAPGYGSKEDSLSINPYVGLSFVSITPQTTWDVYARLGAIYYFDQPDAPGADDTYAQARAGINMTHRFSDRLRISSRNFLSYELEPDYSYGFASTRQMGEYFFWQTDNAVGYRWTDRLATYTGFQLTGLDYDDVPNADRFTYTLYNQFRYLLGPQDVLTAEYRYAGTDADGLAPDSDSHYLLVGIEHRFNPSSVLIARAGAQFTDTDGGDSDTNPFVELAVNTQVNQQFQVRGFLRYSVEAYDTVQVVGNSYYNFDDRKTLRIGVSGNYTISDSLSFYGGVDYIPASFDGGRLVGGTGPSTTSDRDENLVNAYVGVSMKFTDYLTGSLTYNYTNSDSDFSNRDYDRNRVTVGVHAEF